MKFLIALPALLLFAAHSFAQEQTGRITGTVMDAGNNPAAGITVLLEASGKTAVTGENGIFVLKGVPPGVHTLRISLPRHRDARKTVTVTAGETAHADMRLAVPAATLEGVTVTGSRNGFKAGKTSPSLRIEGPLRDIPQNIQVVTGQVLTSQQVLSMSDGVIRNVSGATRLEHWGDLYTRVNARGSRLSAFRNGVNITSDWGPLDEDMSFVDHIEFVKGPAGFMMSNGEPSGIYNVVTKKPTGVTRGTATLTLGSFDLYRATLDLDGRLSRDGRLLYRLNLMGQNKNSFRDYEFNNRFSIAPVISYQLDDKTLLTAEYTYQHVRMSDLGSAYVFSTEGYATLPRDFTFSEPGLEPNHVGEHSAFLNLQHRFNTHWKLTAQAAHFDDKQVASDIWPEAVLPDGKAIRDLYSFDAALKNSFGQVFLNGNVQTGKVHHRILTGVDMGTKKELYDWGQIFPLDSAGAEFDSKHPVYGSPAYGYPQIDRSSSLDQRAVSRINQSYTGLYFQDELGFWDNKVRLTLAGRYTFVRQSSDGEQITAKKFTPRAGLSVSLGKQASVYALYDQSFLPQTGVLRGGKTPKPITGNNIELGLKKDWFGSRLSTTLSLYRIIKNNELSPDPTSTPAEPYSLQLGQSTAEGVEFEARGEIAAGLSIVANYAYTDSYVSKETEDYGNIVKKGTRIAGFAKHDANAWLVYRLHSSVLKGLGISAGFNYQAGRSTWSWTTEPSRENLPDYFKLDAGLSWEHRQLTLTANVFNILNTYLYSGADYGNYYYWQAEAPRNLRFSVAYRF
ncbi:TonB-dependent siderophore receptor [Compostibacter hankyongensis]|uniref:TonB-dependent siderophore receptor n=1 Tax=Compostibacter hankyongensis TaxID=1007089 RepID=A0ABP8FZD6_9BACT